MKTTIPQILIFRTFSRLKRSSFSAVFLLLFLLSASSSWGQTYRSVTAPSVVSGGSITITKPSGLVVGDLMVAQITRSSNNDTDMDDAARSGWTVVSGNQYRSNNNDRWHTTILSKVATASDVSATNFTFTGNETDEIGGAIMAFSGTCDVTVIGSWASLSNSSDGTYNAPAISTITQNSLVIMFGVVADSDRTATGWSFNSTTMAERYDIVNGNNKKFVMAAATLPTTSILTNIAGSATLSGNGRNTSILLAISPPNTVTAASATPTLCVNTALTNITHTTTGATGIGTATGLPAGVTPAWASNTITISGTPTASGTFNYSIPLTGGCGSVNATGTITVNPVPTALSITPASATICNGSIQSLVSSGGTSITVVSGAPVTSSGTLQGAVGNPIRTGYGASKCQVIYTASELTAAGFSSGSIINSLTLNISSAGDTRTGFTISYKYQSGSTFANTTMLTGFTSVFSLATLSTSIGYKTFNFTTPTNTWNGTDNIVFDFCFSNNASGVTSPIISAVAATSGDTVLQVNADNTTTLCSSTTGTLGKTRPYIQLSGTKLITWTPITGLYTNSDATTAYTSGSSATTVYAKPTTTITYTATATSTEGCTSTKTVEVTVTAAPSAGSLGGTQAICVGGTSNLSSTESGGTWQSDDSGIATINSTTGVATGISSGVTTMTYTITGTGGCSNATATTTVTVNSAPSIGTLSGTQTVCVGATTTFSSTESGESWTSGSTGVATINSSTGVITGVSAGTAIITYTFSGNGVCENAIATRTVTVTPTFIASVSIASSDVDNTICPGTSVTFTATPTNGGTSPSYQWKLNGSTNVGSNSPTFVTTALANNDLVTVEMTSNETCVTSSPATSNSISTTVDSNLPASVSIISSDNDNTICSGSNVVFTATPTNGGSPSYQWKLNGNSIGSDSNTFTSSSLTNNDVISVVMSSQTCSSGTAVTSNSITTVVNPSSVGGTVNSPTLCYNTAGNILLSGYTGIIQWQQSADGLTGWTNISGATSNTYTTPNLTAANSYRAVVTSGICSSANSNVSVVNVDDENVNTWIGTSGNWNDATKWRCGTVPTGITDVVVSGGSPVINADCSVKSITVSGTGLVTVQSSVTLTMTEGITTTVATQFVLENNANLLQGDSAQNVGPIIVKRNSSSIMRLDYTLWSSPVASQGLYAFSKATLPNRFYKYDTETNLYSNSVGFNLTNLQYPSPLVAPNGINGTDSNNVMFNTGQGYLIRVPWNHPIAPAFWTGYFVGVPNNGTINYTMSDFGVGKRFNLVGNPYPSPISISQFVQDNATNITSSVYFFRKTNGNTTTGSYCEWNDEIFTSNNDNQAFDPNDSVRTGQGFFVEATGAGNTIVFNNGQRVNDAGNQFFRQNANNTLTSQNVFWLNLTGTATQFSQTAISYKDYATNGVDRYDAKRMSPGTISLTSLVDGFNMGIQSKSAFVDTDVVLLSMIVPTAGSYSITLDRKSGLFADGQIIYLKDKLLNVDFNLATGSYTFVSEAGTFNDRFEIQYERNSLGVTSPIFNENQVVIYKTPTGSLSIKTGNVTMSLVKVFDVSGKLLFEKKDINASQTEFNIGLTTEILLVQITSDDGVVVTKKVLFPRTTLKIDKKIEVKSQLAEDE